MAEAGRWQNKICALVTGISSKRRDKDRDTAKNESVPLSSKLINALHVEIALCLKIDSTNSKCWQDCGK